MSLLPIDAAGQLPKAANTSGVSPESSPQQLKALAAQFESMLVAQMLQQMRKSMFEDGEESSMNAPLSDTLFAELSLAITRAGGLGLGDSVLSPLTRQAGVDDALPAVSPARVSSAYGWRRDPVDSSMKFHHGIDIALPAGQDVPAPQPGRVVFAGEQRGYGQTVIVEHRGGMTTRYAHLSAIEVKTGDEVAMGQSLGKVGSTGKATGAHLHFEVLERGKSVNPPEKLTAYMAGQPQ